MSGFLSRTPLDASALLAEVQSPERGATALFLGTVRRGPDDGPVGRIEYSAYEAMVEREFGAIIAEAEARWPEAGLVARHRVGDVPVGEASIAVAAAAPHRQQAFDACRYVVDEAKRRLPVWKREVMDDGAAHWRDNGGGRVPSEPGAK